MEHWAKMGHILFEEKLKQFAIAKFLMHVNGMVIIIYSYNSAIINFHAKM